MAGWRRASCIAVALFVVAGSFAAAPADAAEGGNRDLIGDLGAGSPTCQYVVQPRERANCRQSGSVAHAYPLTSYGFDVRVGFSLTDMGESFLGALQNIAALLWMALVFLLKAALLLLEWSFSLDLTARAMPEARRTLAQLHGQVFGDPWLLAALSVVALWGIWRGLIQRQAVQTLTGVAATVALMVVALLIIARPGATIGYASTLANEGAAGVLAASRGTDVSQPRPALAAALREVFDAMVRDPWCALEFGSVRYCNTRARGVSRTTNADVWLRYPAQSKERASLFKLLKGKKPDTGGGVLDSIPAPGAVKGVLGIGGDDAKLPDDVVDMVRADPERARMQEAGGTFPRFALLAVIAVGLLGGAAMLTYLGVRLLLAAAMVVLLLLLAPAMLLAPAFGDSGRSTFVAWGRRLIGAIAAKLIYALFLAVVLAAARVFISLDVGWFGTWLLMAAFWWGVLLKRQEIVGFVSVGAVKTSHGSLSGALAQGYYAAQLTRGVRRRAGSSLRSTGRLVGEARQRRAETGAARASAVAAVAGEQLDAHARSALITENRDARQLAGRRPGLERDARAVDRRLHGFDEAVVAARALGQAEPTPTPEQQALLQRRQRLSEALGDDALVAAQQRVRHAAVNRARGHDDVAPADVGAYRARRRQELDADLPLTDPRHLRAAGIDPREFAAADAPRRQELEATVRQHLSDERRLLAAASGHAAPEVQPLLPQDEVRRRTRDERLRLREERRQRRARAGVFRGR